MAQRAPQSRGLYQQFQRDVALEVGVAGCSHVTNCRVGDIGVDVKGRGTGRPVSRAFLAADGAPRKRCASQAKLRSAL
jgi:hypothetical protein